VLLGERASARARVLETMLIERRVVTPAASRPAPAATVFKEGGALGTVMRLEPPFGNLETSVVEADLRFLHILPGNWFDVRCGKKTVTLLLGQHWADVPRDGWVAYFSLEGSLIVARNSGNASETLGCQSGDSVVVSPRTQ
jgi:S-adenosylmethionine hydrolase